MTISKEKKEMWVSRRSFISKRAAQRYAQATGLTDTIAKTNLRSAVLAKQQTEYDRKMDKIDRRLQKLQEDF
jgi:hypothetical protein